MTNGAFARIRIDQLYGTRMAVRSLRGARQPFSAKSNSVNRSPDEVSMSSMSRTDNPHDAEHLPPG